VAKLKFTNNSEKAISLFIQRISENMQEVQAEYMRDLHDVLTNEPQGRYWKDAGTPRFQEVPGPGPGVHRASRPGDPPTVFKGLLRDSIKSHVVNVTNRQYSGAVTTEADYAATLELGGVNKTGHRIEPRPAWLPTLLYNRKKYALIATKGFKSKA